MSSNANIGVAIFVAAWIALAFSFVSLCVRLSQVQPADKRDGMFFKFMKLAGGWRFWLLIFGNVHTKIQDRAVTRWVYACRIAYVTALVGFAIGALDLQSPRRVSPDKAGLDTNANSPDSQRPGSGFPAPPPAGR